MYWIWHTFSFKFRKPRKYLHVLIDCVCHRNIVFWWCYNKCITIDPIYWHDNLTITITDWTTNIFTIRKHNTLVTRSNIYDPNENWDVEFSLLKTATKILDIVSDVWIFMKAFFDDTTLMTNLLSLYFSFTKQKKLILLSKINFYIKLRC